MYKGYIGHPVAAQSLVIPHVKYVCVLLPLVMPYVRHAHLGLHIGVKLKGRTTRIRSFNFNFACATIMGCAGFKLLFGIIIDYYQIKDQELRVFYPCWLTTVLRNLFAIVCVFYSHDGTNTTILLNLPMHIFTNVYLLLSGNCITKLM